MSKKNQPPDKLTTWERLKAKGKERRPVDLSDASIAFYESKKDAFDKLSGKSLMEAILKRLAEHKNAEAIIKSILYPPK